MQCSTFPLLLQVDLVRSSERRASRGGVNFRDATHEYDTAITNLADFAHEIIDKVNARLANTPREERWLRRMAATLDLRAMAFPTGAVANGLATAAATAAATFVSLTDVGLTYGARLEVLVSEDGEPDVWWSAAIGGPTTGAGGHGVIIVYDAWALHGHANTTTSRACFNLDGQTLLDVDEMATWRWRFPTPPPAAVLPNAQPLAVPPPAAPGAARLPAAVAAHAVTAAADASAVADATAAAALLGGDAAATAARSEIFKLAWHVSQQGITARAEFDALLLLAEWMATRFDCAPPAAPPAAPPPAPPAAAHTPRPMPGIVALWAQRSLLRRRLREAATAYPYSSTWTGVSGTVIMESVFTHERFYQARPLSGRALQSLQSPSHSISHNWLSLLVVQGCEDFLYLFQHCATKTSCEAVVEGMGSVWDESATERRHVGFESGVHDAVVAYSAPAPHLPEADQFITRALNTYFEGGPDKWNFKNEDARFRNVVFSGGSKVIAKLGKAKSRLPAAFYRTVP